MLTKDELVAWMTKELVALQGGWQNAETKLNEAKHSAERIVERLLEEAHIKVK